MSRKSQSPRLWTPIANALEVYRRRLIAAPDAVYEHIWRIIHIEEAMIVLLGSALASRLHSVWSESTGQREKLNELRSKVTGLLISDDGTIANTDSRQGCWHGSIGAWTDLLNLYGRKDIEPTCHFCIALGEYLEEEPEEDIALIEAWQRISPVPNEIFKTRIGRLKAINNLRNKLAHVPVSEKLLSGVHQGLRREILGLLSPDQALLKQDTGADIVTTKWHKPLIGRLCTPQAGVTGSDFCQHDGHHGENHNLGRIWFDWAQCDDDVTWSASPFVLLDNELKAMLLFRVDGIEDDPGERDVDAEYYRFGAEIEPVQKLLIRKDHVQPWIPEPLEMYRGAEGGAEDGSNRTTDDKDTKVVTDDAELPNLSTMEAGELRTLAEKYYRSRNYPDAVATFDELSKHGHIPEYNHVTMLHHGEAIWKMAEHDTNNIENRDAKGQISMLERAVEILGTAIEHRDITYAARAYYQRSKAYRRLWMHTGNASYYKKALEDASEAARIAYDSQYISWYERITGEKPDDVPA